MQSFDATVVVPTNFVLFTISAIISGKLLFLKQYLSRGIQFSRASLNGALTQHKNKGIKTLKLAN